MEDTRIYARIYVYMTVRASENRWSFPIKSIDVLTNQGKQYSDACNYEA
jgi:hypothetical protein